MASIFTYDSVLQRVSSPWNTPSETPNPSSPSSQEVRPVPSSSISESVTRLEPEPQEGPTEYKLHLLLRPRRAYSYTSTGSTVSGSRLHKQQAGSQSKVLNKPSPLASSTQSRQQRLEQLTTQLLWRLQQSSPYHASSKSTLIIPKLPEIDERGKINPRPNNLLAGLEQSRGALYEIGVSDDGTLIGLTPDEMEESLETLHAMATSLGCNVEVLRRIIVGKCEWHEAHEADDDQTTRTVSQSQLPLMNERSNGPRSLHHKSELSVVEALIMPNLCLEKPMPSLHSALDIVTPDGSAPQTEKHSARTFSPASRTTTEQLRVTITGPSASGKSSLLGTLLTTNLDNGRGKSRVTSLKHPHELASGVTSSVAHELIGYKDGNVINYATGDVTTWTDIHAAADGGRLVCMTDSAGLPKYQRTTLRGLVGWDPHWLALCLGLGENESDASSARYSPSNLGAGPNDLEIDSAGVFLDLCLKLDKPLAIIITKYDLASKARLRQMLTNIYSAVKSSKRTPSFIRQDPSEGSSGNFNTISRTANEHVQAALQPMIASGDFTSIVPIVVTSATTGQGMQTLHSLLQNLPVPVAPTMHGFVGTTRMNPEQPACLFHIEDTYDVAASSLPLVSSAASELNVGFVVAGHLRFGSLSIGNTVMIGPFSTNTSISPPSSRRRSARSSPATFGSLLSHNTPRGYSLTEQNSIVPESTIEWYTASIVSIRNLRLPVHTLDAGQVGTVGVIFDGNDFPQSGTMKPIRIRKGMVMAVPSQHMSETGTTLQAASKFTASFRDSDVVSLSPGNSVIVYIASIRAAARIISSSPVEASSPSHSKTNDYPDDIFSLDAFDLEQDRESTSTSQEFEASTELTMELLTNREWIELGSPVLLMPNRGAGLSDGPDRGKGGVAGLEGCVGRVTIVEE